MANVVDEEKGGTMTLEIISPGEVYTVRVIKRSGAIYWANGYEVQYDAQTTSPDASGTIVDLANAVVELERELHLTTTTIDRVVISTIQPDGVPYNPLTFAVVNVNLPGQRTIPIGQSPMPLNNCLLVKRRATLGRSGNLLYRGVLRTGDGTIGPEGMVVNGDTLSDFQSALGDFLGDLAAIGFRLVLARMDQSGAIENVRLVTELVPRALTTVKKLYNRYFDIANP